MNYKKLIESLKIKPIPIQDEIKKPPRHWPLFSVHYPAIACIAKKRSGKTTVIYNIIKKALQPRETRVIIFCPNHLKDPGWKSIKDFIKSKGNEMLVFTSIVNENKVNQLEQLLQELEDENENESDEESEEEEDEEGTFNYDIDRPCRFDDEFFDKKEGKKERKKTFKYDYAQNIIIFDDISNELKNPYVAKLLKNGRHHKAMIICSTQYIHDLRPESLKQMDYCLLFKSFDKTKLDKIYTALDLNLGKNGQDKFYELYKHATSKPYSFLYIDRDSDDFRQNFYPRYNLKKFLDADDEGD